MFQIHPLPRTQFAHLFGLSDEALAQQGVVAKIADADRGMPCRVSLRDARRGERVLLLNHQHLDVSSPYRSAYAIYVIDGADQLDLAPGDLPPVFEGRTLAARGFDANGQLLTAALAQGGEVRSSIERFFENPAVAWVDVHNAIPGCYAARASRV